MVTLFTNESDPSRSMLLRSSGYWLAVASQMMPASTPLCLMSLATSLTVGLKTPRSWTAFSKASQRPSFFKRMRVCFPTEAASGLPSAVLTPGRNRSSIPEIPSSSFLTAITGRR